jgi:elongation factor G
MKAHIYQTDGSGKSTESAIPADFTARSQEYRDQLVEAVAESDEKLMEKFFDSGSLTDEELMAGLKKQVAEAKIYPVLYSSAAGNIGIQPLLNSILNLLPDAVARGSVTGKDFMARKSSGRFHSEPFSAQSSRRFQIHLPEESRCFAFYPEH